MDGGERDRYLLPSIQLLLNNSDNLYSSSQLTKDHLNNSNYQKASTPGSSAAQLLVPFWSLPEFSTLPQQPIKVTTYTRIQLPIQQKEETQQTIEKNVQNTNVNTNTNINNIELIQQKVSSSVQQEETSLQRKDSEPKSEKVEISSPNSIECDQDMDNQEEKDEINSKEQNEHGHNDSFDSYSEEDDEYFTEEEEEKDDDEDDYEEEQQKAIKRKKAKKAKKTNHNVKPPSSKKTSDAKRCQAVNKQKNQPCRNLALLDYVGPNPLYCAEHIHLDANSLLQKCSATCFPGSIPKQKVCKEIILKEVGICHKHMKDYLRHCDLYSYEKLGEQALINTQKLLDRVNLVLQQLKADASSAKLNDRETFQRKAKLISKYRSIRSSLMGNLTFLTAQKKGNEAKHKEK